MKEPMKNFIKDRADELDLGPEDISFELAKLDVKVTAQAVRYWLAGSSPPGLTFADPLAKVLKTTRAKILEAMHSIAEDRKVTTAGK